MHCCTAAKLGPPKPSENGNSTPSTCTAFGRLSLLFTNDRTLKNVLVKAKLDHKEHQSSKKFHETDHVTRCNDCWNLFRIVVAHKFQLKVSTCNSGFTASYRSFILVVITRQMFYHFRVCCTSICSDQVFWAIEKHGHWKSDFENWLFCFGNNRWNAIKQHGQSVRIGDQWLGWYKC